MSKLIYGILIGILMGFLIGRYIGQPAAQEGFQTTANDSVPEMNPATSCATIEALSQAFITRMENNPIFTLDSGSSTELATRKDSLKQLIESHKKTLQEQKTKLGCS